MNKEYREELRKVGLEVNDDTNLSSNEYEVNQLLREDINKLVEIAHVWMIDSQTKDLDIQAVEEFKDRLLTSLTEFDIQFLVLRNSKNSPIGCIAFREPEQKMKKYKSVKQAKTSELINMYLLKEYHGKGLGFKLIQELFNKLEKLGYTEVIWNSGPRFKDTAWDFYTKVAGEPINIAKDFYGKGFDAPVWRKTLP